MANGYKYCIILERKIHTLKKLANIRYLPRYFAILSTLILLSLCIATPAAQASPQVCSLNDVKCVITLGNLRIAMRQTALATLKAKVVTQQQAHHIADNQATTLLNDIKANQDGLADLKTKLDAETNVQAARQDVRHIDTQLRIYDVVLRRDYHRLHLDIEVTILDKLKDLEPHIQNSINKAPSDQQAQLTTLFNDYKAQLAESESQLDIAQAALPTLTVTNFNTNHAAYAASMGNLISAEQKIHADLHKALSDLHQIVQIRKAK